MLQKILKSALVFRILILNIRVFQAVGILREQGYKTGIITNNYKVTDTVDKDCIEQLMSELHKRMDVVMESCLYGRKKPDPSIYEAAIKKIEVPAHRIVYLDDIGVSTCLVTKTAVECERIYLYLLTGQFKTSICSWNENHQSRSQ